MPRGGNRISDPTAATAAKRDKLLRDVRMIEQAARVAAEIQGNKTLYPALLRAVTTRGGAQSVFANPDIRPACGERQFYAARRIFYWVLREMKCGDLEPMPYKGQHNAVLLCYKVNVHSWGQAVSSYHQRIMRAGDRPQVVLPGGGFPPGAGF